MGRSAGGCTGSSLERKHYVSITVFGLLHAATREGNALLSECPRLFGPLGSVGGIVWHDPMLGPPANIAALVGRAVC